MANSRLRYHLLALAVVLVWGVTFVSTKVLIGAGMHPVDIFWIRFVLAYVGIWVYILLTGRTRTLWYGWKEELVFLFLGVTGGSFYFLSENTALAYTQASNVSFLVCSAPLFTAILTLLYRRFGKGRFADSLEKVRLGWPLIGGTILALFGMALVAFEGSRLKLSPKGDLLAIGAAICWALYSLFMGEMARRYGTVTATRKVFFYGLLTIIPFLGGHSQSLTPEVLGQTAVWGNLLFLGVVASLVCFIAWNLVIDKLGNVTSTNYVYLNPVFTLLTAMLLLGERMTPLSALGCAAILGGVIWAGASKPDLKTLNTMLKIGDKMPSFEVVDQDGNAVKSEDFIGNGRKTIIYFYPKDNTSGCTAEACSFRDNYAELTAAGYNVVGVSKDSAKSHAGFRAKYELPFRLLADTSLQMLQDFGAWGEKKMYGKSTMGTLRRTFIFDENGILERIIEKVDTKNAAGQILG